MRGITCGVFVNGRDGRRAAPELLKISKLYGLQSSGRCVGGHGGPRSTGNNENPMDLHGFEGGVESE